MLWWRFFHVCVCACKDTRLSVVTRKCGQIDRSFRTRYALIGSCTILWICALDYETNDCSTVQQREIHFFQWNPLHKTITISTRNKGSPGFTQSNPFSSVSNEISFLLHHTLIFLWLFLVTLRLLQSTKVSPTKPLHKTYMHALCVP